MIKPELFKIQDYLKQVFQCSCGKEHHSDLKEVNISQKALQSIPSYIEKYGHKKAFFVYDSNTYEAAGIQIKEIMSNSKLEFTSCILEHRELVPNEKTIGEIITRFDRNCDLIIGVGTGTINDICKFLSFQMNMEYYIVATAPSMDGFASSGSALIIGNMKITYEVHVPTVIIADVDVIRNAPMDMIAAGISDILGKYTCLCDWKMSNIINDEYYCDVIVSMIKKCIETIVESISLVRSRDPKVITSVMEGLILSGIAMSFVGNSRPASGSEHHISHYWEMIFLYEGKKAVLHGTKVGIGTVAILKAYELLAGKNIDFNKAREKANAFSMETWEENIKRTYEGAASDVIKLENKTHKNRTKEVLNRIDTVEKNWNRIVNVISTELPKAELIIDMLKDLKAPFKPEQVGIDNRTFFDSIIVAKELRNRFGLLQLLFDLGLAEETADNLIEFFTDLQ